MSSHLESNTDSTIEKMSMKPQLRSSSLDTPADLKRGHCAKLSGLECFLQSRDPVKRDGRSLHQYHRVWKKSNTNEDFFYWLLEGQGYRLMLKAHTFKWRRTLGIRHRYPVGTRIMLTTMAIKPHIDPDRVQRACSKHAGIIYENMITGHQEPSSSNIGSPNGETSSEMSDEESGEEGKDAFPDLVTPALTEQRLGKHRTDLALCQTPSIDDWLKGITSAEPMASDSELANVVCPFTR